MLYCRLSFYSLVFVRLFFWDCRFYFLLFTWGMIFFNALVTAFFIWVVLLVYIPWWSHFLPPNCIRSSIDSEKNPRINLFFLSAELPCSFFHNLLVLIPLIVSIFAFIVELRFLVIVSSVKFLFFLLNLRFSRFSLISKIVISLSVFLLLF